MVGVRALEYISVYTGQRLRGRLLQRFELLARVVGLLEQDVELIDVFVELLDIVEHGLSVVVNYTSGQRVARRCCRRRCRRRRHFRRSVPPLDDDTQQQPNYNLCTLDLLICFLSFFTLGFFYSHPLSPLFLPICV